MVDFAVIRELTRRDFSERFAGSVLGSIWSFILPLVNLTIYFVIFSKLMGARLPGSSDSWAYGIYLSSGLIPWMALSGSMARGASVFLDKRHIISKVRLPLPSLVLYVNLSETVTFVISSLLFAMVLVMTGIEPNVHMLALPFVYYLQFLFSFGFGLLFAVLTVFVRDLREVVGVVVQLWFWFTPIVYVPDILPEYASRLLALNPAYILINSYQQVLVFGKSPDYAALMLLTLLSHLLIFGAYVVFRHLEKDVRDFL